MGNLIKDITVTGSATTTLTLDNLSIQKGELYELQSTILNATGTTSTVSIYINDNTTPTNYYHQRVFASSTTTGASRENNSYFLGLLNGNGNVKTKSYVKVTNDGKVIFITKSIRDYGGSSVALFDYNITSTFTVTNVTKISIVTSVSNAISTNSRIQLYKVAEKVQDIEITSATTQQDITVDIQKGNEYLLVSDYYNASGIGGKPLTLLANDITSGYDSQQLTADDTSVAGVRLTNSRFITVASLKRALAITKIKLTNSGIFNYQSSVIREYGTSLADIQKVNGSCDTILTSITKLSILETTAQNAIGIGSRFELYKLI